MSDIKKEDIEKLQSFFKKRNRDIEQEKNEVLNAIAPWLEKIDNSTMSENDKKKNGKELIDVGKFINCYNKKIVIAEAIRQSPNFIVRFEGEKIGLELSSLNIDPEAKNTETKIRNLFDEAESLLKNEIEQYKGVYKVQFIEEIDFKSDRLVIINEIIDLIKGNKRVPKFIDSFIKSPGDGLYIYTEEPVTIANLSREQVVEALQDKEASINGYKKKTGLEKFWLLLVLDGIKESADYPQFDKSVTYDPYETTFDKVFLFNFFKSEVTELKVKN